MKLAVSAESSEVNTAAPSNGALTLIVTGITQSGRSIRTFTFADPQGAPLPGFIPGSHLVVHAGPHTNAYSLTSDGTDPIEYSIETSALEPSVTSPSTTARPGEVPVVAFRSAKSGRVLSTRNGSLSS